MSSSSESVRAAPEEASDSSRRQRSRWGLRVLGIAVVSLAVSVAFPLWQERPLGQASQALEQGQVRYAEFLLEKFLAKHPGHPRALALEARALVGLGRPDEAIALFGQVGAASEADLHAWARALMMKAQWSQALPLLQQVLTIHPDEPDAIYESAACLVRLGQLSDALANAEKLTAHPVHAARGYVFVGTILGDMGNYEKAAQAFAEVLKREPAAQNLQVTPDEFYLQYGRTYLLMGKPAESLDPLKHSVAIREVPEAFVLLGNAALQLGEPEKARQAWQKAIELSPLDRSAREALANDSLQNGKAEEALTWLKPLEKVAQLPASTTYLFQRTYTLLGNEPEVQKWREVTAKQRRLEELKKDIEVLFRESPHSFWARVVRAYRFADSGNWSEAESLLKQLLEEAPAEPFVIELADAVFRRSTLPSIEKLPIEHF